MYLMLEDAAGLAGSGNQGASAAPQGQPQGGNESFKMPEKFASAKPEDIAKAYVELERKFGETSGKVKDLEVYSKLGDPKQVQEAVDWARAMYQKLQDGTLVLKDAANPQPKSSPSSPLAEGQAPWDAADWEIKSASEQARLIHEYQTSQVMKIISEKEQQFTQGLGQYRNLQSREQQILLEALRMSQETGGKVDIQKILAAANDLAAKSPEDLLKMAVQQMTAGDEQEAEVSRRVTERMAELKQKQDAEQLALINTHASPRPRFTSSKKSREETNQKIVQELKKKGINLF